MKLTIPLALLALTLSSAARADEQDTTRPYFPNISPTYRVQDCSNCQYALVVDWQQRASDFYGPPVDHFDLYRGRSGKTFIKIGTYNGFDNGHIWAFDTSAKKTVSDYTYYVVAVSAAGIESLPSFWVGAALKSNIAPKAAADEITLNRYQGANVDVLGNDFDPATDGDGNLPLLVYGYSSSYTSSDLQITNHLDRLTLTSYTLGDHTISYTAYDRSGGQGTGTLTAHVIDDCNPVAHDLNISTAAGAPVTFDFIAGTGTFHNPAACADYGDPSTATNKLYTFGYNSKVGVIKRNADGTFTYTPAAGYTGTWSTTFMIQNSLTKLLDRANITFTVQ